MRKVSKSILLYLNNLNFRPGVKALSCIFLYIQLYTLRMSSAKIKGRCFTNFQIFRPHKNLPLKILTGFTCMLSDTIKDVKKGGGPQARQKKYLDL
tara:strand:+ start:149 stop:436 length:288 start_codon:yes stop_codon:yes gene_type:complete